MLSSMLMAKKGRLSNKLIDYNFNGWVFVKKGQIFATCCDKNFVSCSAINHGTSQAQRPF